MRFYNKITFWENKRRLELLYDFHDMVVDYYNNSEYGWSSERRTENDKARTLRSRINLVMHEISKIVELSGILPILRWTPPPAVGGYIQNVNVIKNIFNLDVYEITPNNITDFLEQSMGIYKNGSRNAIYRTINPFYWLGLALDYLVNLPFMLLGKAGFDSKRIQDSIFGRVLKAIFYLISVLASFLTVLQLIGYLDESKLVIKSLFK